VVKSGCTVRAAAALCPALLEVSGSSGSPACRTAGADDGAVAASAVGAAKAGVATAVVAEAAASRSTDRTRGKATAPAIKSVNETPRAIACDFRGRLDPGADPGSFPNFDNVPP
jgi:hypothetical protein